MSRYLDMIADLLPEAGQDHAHQGHGDRLDQWRAGVAALGAMPAPAGIRIERWSRFVADAEALLDTWGAQAEALGWTALDLFGLHPTHPAARLDCAGLAWLLDGRSVAAMTADRATIRTGNGKTQGFERRDRHGAVVAWEMVAALSCLP